MNQSHSSIAAFEARINMLEAFLANNTQPRPLHEKESGPKMRQKKGENRNKKEMATVFTLHTLSPEPGTEPNAVNRKSYGIITTKREAFVHIASEVPKREAGAQRVLFLSNGDADFAVLQAKFFPDAVPCVDWIHVVEYLWKAAHVFHPESSPQAYAWVKAREAQLAVDDTGTIIQGLKQSLTKSKKLKAPQRKTLRTVTGYLSGVKSRIPYKAWRPATQLARARSEGPAVTSSMTGWNERVCVGRGRVLRRYRKYGPSTLTATPKASPSTASLREQERLYGGRTCHAARPSHRMATTR